MDESCPYCGKETSAMKNHVRLASGDGHGPNGSYPDDFFQSSTEESPDAEPEETNTDETGTDDVDDAGPIQFDPDEVDAAIEAARAEAYQDGTEDGFEAGYSTAEQELAPETCPECGGQLDTNVAGVKWMRHDGAAAELEEAESLCRSCDLLIPETGDPIPGSNYGVVGEDGVEGADGGWGRVVLGVILGTVALVVGAVKSNDGAATGRDDVFR
jgi:hypothetical protein